MPRQSNYGPGPYEGAPVSGGNKLPFKSNPTAVSQDNDIRFWTLNNGIHPAFPLPSTNQINNGGANDIVLFPTLTYPTNASFGTILGGPVYTLGRQFAAMQMLDAQWNLFPAGGPSAALNLLTSGYRLLLKGQTILDYIPFAMQSSPFTQLTGVQAIMLLNPFIKVNFDSIQFCIEGGFGPRDQMLSCRFMTYMNSNDSMMPVITPLILAT